MILLQFRYDSAAAFDHCAVLCYIQIHKYKVADASAHHKQMENFVGTEIFVLGIKDGQLQGVYNAACRIDDAACKEPHKGTARQCAP